MKEEIKELLDEAKLNINNLKSGLVIRTDPAQVSFIAKTPYKALNIREALLYRVTDLADATYMLIESDNLVAAACTARAFQETVALLFCVNRKTKKAIAGNDVACLDKDLMRILLGAKNNQDMPDPINILTMVDGVNKDIPGFRDVYDNLSELAHPNWAGTLGTYTKVNKEMLWTDYGKNIRLGDTNRQQIAFALNAGLDIVISAYNEFTEFMPDLINICEEAIRSKKHLI